MSGYKNMWFSTGEEHRAFLAFAAIEHGATSEDALCGNAEKALDEWDGMSPDRRERYFTAAELITSDAVTLRY